MQEREPHTCGLYIPSFLPRNVQTAKPRPRSGIISNYRLRVRVSLNQGLELSGTLPRLPQPHLHLWACTTGVLPQLPRSGSESMLLPLPRPRFLAVLCSCFPRDGLLGKIDPVFFVGNGSGIIPWGNHAIAGDKTRGDLARRGAPPLPPIQEYLSQRA